MYKVKNNLIYLTLIALILSLNLASAVTCTDVGASPNGVCNTINSDGNFIVQIISGVHDMIIIISPLIPVLISIFIIVVILLLLAFLLAFFGLRR